MLKYKVNEDINTHLIGQTGQHMVTFVTCMNIILKRWFRSYSEA